MTASEFRKVLAENVRARRKELGITQSELADTCGWFQPKVSGIEAGKHSLPADDLAILANALRTTPSALVSPGNFSPVLA